LRQSCGSPAGFRAPATFQPAGAPEFEDVAIFALRGLRGGVEALLKVFGGEILGFAHQVIGSFSRRVHVSRPQRGTQVLRCRPGIVASAALVKVPALRCTAGALHRVRDTSVVSDKHIRSRAAFASELCDHHASSKTQPLARTKARGAERRKTQSNHCPPRKTSVRNERRLSAFGAEARHRMRCLRNDSACGARSPSGAPLRLSSGL
jgi:hypothetical protein